MAISVVGNGGTIAEVDGTNWRGLRTTVRPPEYGSGGYYRTTLTGTTAAGPAAAAPLASIRWTSGSQIMLVNHLEMRIQVSTASTAGLPELSAYVARSFSASDTGGTAVVLTGNNNKLRATMGTSAIGDIRAANAGVLTAGTRALDANPFLTCATALALGSTDRVSMDLNAPSDHPLILGANEGLVFANVTALTAGIYRYTITMEWAEVAAF